MRIVAPLPSPTYWQRSSVKGLFATVQRAPRPDDGVVTAFRDGQVTLRTNRRVEGFTNAIAEHGYQGIRRGDLVIHSMDGFAGAIGVSDSDGKASPVVHAYRPLDGNDPRFFAYLLRELARSGFITSLAKGIRERSTAFDASTFRSLVFVVPPVAEQRRIADFLDAETARIDALIAKKRRMIDLLNERWQAALHEAMSHVDAGFTAVRRVATLIAGGTPTVDDPSNWDDNGVPWVAIGDMSSVRQVARTQRGVSPAGRAGARLKLGQPGTVLFAMYASVGAISRLRVAACWNQALLGIRGISGLANDDFLELWLLYLRPTLGGLVRSNTQSNLNAEQVGALPFPLLPVGDQAGIAARLSGIRDHQEDLARVLRGQIALLEERRQALITHAVTGQIPVPA